MNNTIIARMITCRHRNLLPDHRARANQRNGKEQADQRSAGQRRLSKNRLGVRGGGERLGDRGERRQAAPGAGLLALFVAGFHADAVGRTRGVDGTAAILMEETARFAAGEKDYQAVGEIIE